MSKFEKRILKSSKQCRNCLVIGSGIGLLNDLIHHCHTVFIMHNDLPKIRNAKVVYRENFNGIDQLHDIDFIFLDYNQYPNLNKIRNLLLKCRPVIFVEGETVFPVEDYKYLSGLGFALIEIFKNMQKWIPK